MVSRLKRQSLASALSKCALQAVDRIIGVQSTIAEELECRAVKRVRSRFGNHVDDCPACASKLSRVAVGIYLELLDRIFAELIGSAAGTGASEGLSEEVVVVVGPVDGQRVQRAALSGKAEIAAAHVAHYAGREQSEVEEVAAIGGQVRNLAIAYRVAHAAARGLNHRGFRGDLHGLIPCGYGQRHLEIDFRADRHLHVLFEDAESAVRRLNPVRANWQQREGEQSIRVGIDGEALAGGGVASGYFAIGDDSAGSIADCPGDRAPTRLREGSGNERDAKRKESEYLEHLAGLGRISIAAL